MDNPELINRVRRLSRRLCDCPAPSHDEQALLGFAIGATFSLQRALALGYTDQTIPDVGPNYLADLRGVAADIADREGPTQGAWLATYYFNSALFRLAALGERVGKYADAGKWDVAPPVRHDVNRMKHEVDVLLKDGREAKIEDAIEALTMVVGALELHLGRFR